MKELMIIRKILKYELVNGTVNKENLELIFEHGVSSLLDISKTTLQTFWFRVLLPREFRLELLCETTKPKQIWRHTESSRSFETLQCIIMRHYFLRVTCTFLVYIINI